MLITWEVITLISFFSALLIILLSLIIVRKKCSKPTTPSDMVAADAEECDEFPSFTQEMIPHQNLDQLGPTKPSYTVFRPRTPFFSWADHPYLLANAVENGWSPFSFVPSPSFKPAESSHLAVPGRDHGNESNVVISWEIFGESADYMQKMRLNPGVRKSITGRNSALSLIRTALPLPGPQFANAAFPQEAYFEVTILPDDQEQAEMNRDEARKLIGGDFDAKKSFEYLNVSKRSKIEEVKIGGNENVGIGLTGGGHLPLKFPGSFPGSVGFNSTGSFYLDGMKLVQESVSEGWVRGGNVIGYGYYPAHKKVFFTLNSKLINEVRCKTEEFGHPLYPTIAANTDVTVVVNLGQSPFRYDAANLHRTPNPCFITTPPNSSTAARYELDSKELFSMGRIDGKWKQWTATRSSESIHVETDQVSEPDLFEIALR